MRHPAKFSDPILDEIKHWVRPHWTVLDVFAGTGRVHELTAHTVGVEIEPEWASLRPGTMVGNALKLPFTDNLFDAIVTSPTYGNRMADHHNATDQSVRNTYKHTLGRDLDPDNSGRLQWGPAYWQFHEKAWREALRVLKPGGLLILNVSDHIRKGSPIPVVEWHTQKLWELGCDLVDDVPIKTKRNGFGANRNVRVPEEWVIVMEKTK